ncbi:protein Mabiki-like [Haematobia irritans]|uniref:protein Mabiki-like n=1 Tax=Haematobia irritans TaxID=7368 RepID=UPI003F4FA82E
MAYTCEYQHKKFQMKAQEYSHKKFGAHMKKRKLSDMEDKENIVTAQSILENAQKEKATDYQEPKRKQMKSLFRPWEDKQETINIQNNSKKSAISPSYSVLTDIPSNVLTYHPNMVRQHNTKPRTAKDQQRRNRNTVACLMSRRKKQIEEMVMQQQYVAYQQQQAAVMEQSLRAAMYLRHLQQMALQRQHQLFVFGQ